MIFSRTIQIPSVRANIRFIEQFILEINREVGLADSILDKIMISVTEAVNNGIVHGNKCHAERNVHVTCNCSAASLEFLVQDEGEGFSPKEVPDPLDERNLLKEGGRGILIIRSLMNTVDFGRNALGMQIRMSIDR